MYGIVVTKSVGGQGSIPVPKGRLCCSPSSSRSHRKSHALILTVKISWMLSPENHFSSENCFSSESASVSKIFGFCWGGTFLGTLLFCRNFFRGRLLHFTALVGTREGGDPAPSAPGGPAGWDRARRRSRSWVRPEPGKCSKCWAAE